MGALISLIWMVQNRVQAQLLPHFELCNRESLLLESSAAPLRTEFVEPGQVTEQELKDSPVVRPAD